MSPGSAGNAITNEAYTSIDLLTTPVSSDAVFFNWDTVKILISMSHIHTDRHTDKRTYYIVPEF